MPIQVVGTGADQRWVFTPAEDTSTEDFISSGGMLQGIADTGGGGQNSWDMYNNPELNSGTFNTYSTPNYGYAPTTTTPTTANYSGSSYDGGSMGYGLVAPQPVGGGSSSTSTSSGGLSDLLGLLSGGGSGGSSAIGNYEGLAGGTGYSVTGSSTGTRQSIAGSTNTAPTTNIYAPTSGSYTQAMNAALSELNTGFAGVRDAINSGRIQNNQQLQSALQDLSAQTGMGIDQITQAFGQAGDALNQGFGQAAGEMRGLLGQAAGMYDPVTGGVGQDVGFLRQGVQGGFDQDFQNYMNSSAFQFPLQQAIENVEQSAANAGKLFSGAAGKAIADRASDYTSQQFENFRNNRINQAANLAGLTTGALGQQTGLLSQLGQGLGSLYAQQGTQGSGLLSQLGTNVLGARTGLGGALANTQLGYSGLNTDLNRALAEATGQKSGVAADYKYQGLTGRGTRAIEIKV